MFKYVSDLETVTSPEITTEVDISGKTPGTFFEGDFIYKIAPGGNVEFVVTRLCDHASGKLFPDNNNENLATCPFHNWQLDLRTLQYTNGTACKERLKFKQEGDKLFVYSRPQYLKAPVMDKVDGDIKIRFLSHACVAVEYNGLLIVTDPWLVGSCFTTGWWHKFPPKEDALEILNRADIIYVSHNHPDHMHEESLKLLKDKGKCIIVPEFESESTVKPLRSWGFTNVHALKFNQVFEIDGQKVNFSIMRAGDFRDDSGLLLTIGDKVILFAVDSNNLNHYLLPENIDVLFTAFAGGATGYPFCFDIYSEEEKRKIHKRNLNAVKNMAGKYLTVTKPKIFVPYAGYFQESDDYYIAEVNKKNALSDIEELTTEKVPGAVFVNPIEYDRITLTGEGFSIGTTTLPRLYEVTPQYVADYKEKLYADVKDFNVAELVEYFGNSGFEDNFELFLQPANDDFAPTGDGAYIDFSNGGKVTITPAAQLKADYDAFTPKANKGKYMLVKKDALARVVRDHGPWEDLSIGFQCRIHRKPDVYNAKFWFHFTNNYIF